MKRKSQELESLSDQQLLGQYRDSGDLQHLGVLYERYTHLIYGVCLKYLKNREDSKDAVMGIFEKLIKELRTREVENWKGWLHVISKNYCLMIIRSRSSKSEINSVQIDPNMEFAIPLHHNEEDIEPELQILEECIEELKNEQKKSVKLFFLKKRCYQEIVEETGFELKKVKSYIQNGKRNLKLCIESKREKV